MKKHFVVSSFIFYYDHYTYKVLVLHHKKLDKWVVPGGHIEDNENPIQAIAREIREETGISEFELISFKHTSYSLFSDSKELLAPEWITEELIPKTKSENQHMHIDLFYVALTKEPNIHLNKDESNNIKWVDILELDQLDAFDSTKCFANMLLKKLNDISSNTKYNTLGVFKG